jgi:hypothetical protein
LSKNEVVESVLKLIYGPFIKIDARKMATNVVRAMLCANH